MSDSTASLQRQIGSATELQSVVRTMRALAGSSISQYEAAVRALAHYHEAVDLGLGACLRAQQAQPTPPSTPVAAARHTAGGVGAVVFGSDQGLIGQFNDVLAEHAIQTLARLPGQPLVWAVGERVRARLESAGLPLLGSYDVPNTVGAIAPLVGRLQFDTETHPAQLAAPHMLVFHNRPLPGALYEPTCRRLLPLDAHWQTELVQKRWPNHCLPEVMGQDGATLRALVREYLFISLFQACAESLTSENASRLAAMQRADKNIDELLTDLQARFHSLRQRAIDEELFDVSAGYEALAAAPPRRSSH